MWLASSTEMGQGPMKRVALSCIVLYIMCVATVPANPQTAIPPSELCFNARWNYNRNFTFLGPLPTDPFGNTYANVDNIRSGTGAYEGTNTGFEEPGVLSVFLAQPVSPLQSPRLVMVAGAPCSDGKFCGFNSSGGAAQAGCSTACGGGYYVNGSFRLLTSCNEAHQCSFVKTGFEMVAAPISETSCCTSTSGTCAKSDPHTGSGSFVLQRTGNSPSNDALVFKFVVDAVATSCLELAINSQTNAMTTGITHVKFVSAAPPYGFGGPEAAQLSAGGALTTTKVPIRDVGSLRVCYRTCRHYCGMYSSCASCGQDPACNWCGTAKGGQCIGATPAPLPSDPGCVVDYFGAFPAATGPLAPSLGLLYVETLNGFFLLEVDDGDQIAFSDLVPFGSKVTLAIIGQNLDAVKWYMNGEFVRQSTTPPYFRVTPTAQDADNGGVEAWSEFQGVVDKWISLLIVGTGKFGGSCTRNVTFRVVANATTLSGPSKAPFTRQPGPHGICDATTLPLNSSGCCVSCSVHRTCSACVAASGCGWCADSNSCLARSMTGAPCGSAQCTTFFGDNCVAPVLIPAISAHVVTTQTFSSTTQITQYTVVDTADVGGPSSWRVDTSKSAMVQTSRIGSGLPTNASVGTTLLYVEGETLKWSQYRIVVRTLATTNQAIGVVVRGREEDGYHYIFEWISSKVYDPACGAGNTAFTRRFKRVTDDTLTILVSDSVGFLPTIYDTIDITVSEGSKGTTLTAFVNGHYVFSVMDDHADRPLWGTFGFGTVGTEGWFRDVTVYAPVVTVESGGTSFTTLYQTYLKVPPAATGLSRVLVRISTGTGILPLGTTLAHRTLSVPVDGDDKVTPGPGDASIGVVIAGTVDTFLQLSTLQAPGFLNLVAAAFIVPAATLQLNQELTITAPNGFLQAVLLPDSSYKATLRITYERQPDRAFTLLLQENSWPTSTNYKLSVSGPNGTGTSTTYQHILLSDAQQFIAVTISPLLNMTISLEVHVVPDITSVTPTTLGTQGGVLDIRGTNFGTTSGSVAVGPFDCAVQTWSPTRILCNLESGEGADHVVTVTRLGATSNSKSFSYDKPQITSDPSPSTGRTVGGYTVTIRGVNFGRGSIHPPVVKFGNVSLTVESVSQTAVVCIVPPGVGTAAVTVSVAGQVSSELRNFVYLGPVQSSVTPQVLPVAPSRFVIRGDNFGPSAEPVSVSVGGLPVKVINHNHTYILCESELSTGGTDQPISVVVGSPAGASLQISYEPPVVHAVVPDQLSTTGGDVLTLYGRNFGSNSTTLSIQLPVGTCESFVGPLGQNNTFRTCRTPQGVGINLGLTVTLAGQQSSLAPLLSYKKPVIASVDPTEASTAGSTVTVYGTNFAPDATFAHRLLVSGTISLSILSINATRIVAVYPSGAGVFPGIHAEIGSQTSNTFPITYGAPRISAVTYTSLPVTGGGIVTISGQNFGTGFLLSGRLLYGSSELTLSPCSVVIPHVRLTCTTPPGPIVNGTIVVSVAGQLSRADNPTAVISYDPPIITSVTPASAPAGGVITLIGNNFGSSTFATNGLASVTVGGRPCVSYPVYSTDSVQCTVPQGEGRGLDILVNVSGQTATARSAFSYPAPEVTAVSPTSGIARGGFNVTVSGQHFGFGLQESFLVYLQYCPFVGTAQAAFFNGVTIWYATANGVAVQSNQTATAEFSPQVTRDGVYSISLQSNAQYVKVHHVGGSTLVTLPWGAVRWLVIGLFNLNATSTVEVLTEATSTAVEIRSLSLCLEDTTATATMSVPYSLMEVIPSIPPALAQVTFPAPAGVGGSWSIRVKSGGQVSPAVSSTTQLSYDQPVIDVVRGCAEDAGAGTRRCSLSGGELLTIVGQNFGAAQLLVALRVNASVSVNERVCTGLKVLNDTALTCSSPPSSSGGTNVPVIATIAGVSSVPVSLVAYIGPELTPGTVRLCSESQLRAEVNLSSVNGGDVICFNGSNIDSDASVWMGTSTHSRQDIPTTLFQLPADAPIHSITHGVWFECTQVVVFGSSGVRCTVPTGVGNGLKLVLRSANSWAFGSDIINYPRPTFIDRTVRGTVSAGTGASVLTLSSSLGGRVVFDVTGLVADNANFTYRGIVLITLAGPTTDSTCEDVEVATYSGGKALSCRVGSGQGSGFAPIMQSIGVHVTGNDTVSFPNNVPTVTKVKGCKSSGTSATRCSTTGGTRITISGTRFCGATDDCGSASVSVTLDGFGSCSQVNLVSQFKLMCVLPPGAGSGDAVSITVNINGALSQPVALVSYATPVVTQLSAPKCTLSAFDRRLLDCPTDQAIDLTISGSNFGRPTAVVVVGRNTCQNVTLVQDTGHSMLTCTLPPAAGVGNGQAFPVFVIGSSGGPPAQPVVPFPQLTISYASCDRGFVTDTSGLVCTPCAAGLFATGNECVDCPAGRFSTSGLTSCNDCPEGRFTDTTARSVCTQCGDGKYAPRPGLSQCIECPAGQFAIGPGAIGCQSCVGGTFAEQTGQSSCQICGNGTTGGTGHSVCTACVPGRFSVLGQPCSDCSPGYHQSAFQGSSCSACEVGTYQRSFGAAHCVPCSTGQFSNDTGLSLCLRCAKGRFSRVSEVGNRECVPCPDGTYLSNEGQGGCLSCSPGKFTNGSGATACSACPQGRVAASNSLGIICTMCAAGKFSSDGVLCSDCAPGFVSLAPGSHSCSECAPGFISGTGHSTCTSCSAGTYNPSSRQVRCRLCPGGAIANTTGLSSCTSCQRGRIPSPDGVSCLACPPGSTARDPGSQNCVQCLPGFFSADAGSSACTQCLPGKSASSSGSTVCTNCSLGQFSFLPATAQCFTCAAGTVAPQEGLTSCEVCPEGTAQAAAGAQHCSTCEPGTFASKPGATECRQCARGTFSDRPAAFNCTKCGVGAAQGDAGKSFCAVCDHGTVSSITGSAACLDCLAGRRSNAARDECVACPPGHSSDRKSSSCVKCSPGTFALASASPQCIECDVGRIAPQEGMTACDFCKPGLYWPTQRGIKCKKCEAGRAQGDPGEETCNDCTPGRFTNMTGATECFPCPIGTFSGRDGGSSCQRCPIGRYGPVHGLGLCLECAPGLFLESSGGTTCDSCAAGYVQSRPGQSHCVPCDVGRHIGGKGESACELCGAGMFANETGAQSCTPCTAGRWQQNLGSSSCSDCPRGQFSKTPFASCTLCSGNSVAEEPGTAICSACPAGTQANTGHTACLCAPGFYFAQSRLCEPCPSGGDCSNAGTTWRTMAAQPGYWRAGNHSLVFYECLVEIHCNGGFSSECAANREGPLCALCRPGTQLGNDGQCNPCREGGGSEAVMSVIIVCLFIALIVMYWISLYSDRHLIRRIEVNDERRVLLHMRQGTSHFDQLAEERLDNAGKHADGVRPVGRPNLTYKMKIVLSFFQIATNIAYTLELPWPRLFRSFLSVFNVVNLDFIQWSSADCVTKIDYYDRLVIVTLVPIGILMGIAAFYLFPYYFRYPAGLALSWPSLLQRCAKASWLEADEFKVHYYARKRRRRKAWKLVLFTLFLVYPLVSATIFGLYVCREVNGVSYLLSDFTIRCYDTKWYRFLPYDVLMILVYPLGVPLFFAYLLWRYRPRFRLPGVRLQLGFLYDGFAYGMWWFELLDMAHKLSLTSLCPFFPKETQLPSAMIIIYSYAIVVLLSKPDFWAGDDRLRLLSSSELFLLVLAGYINQANFRNLSDFEDALLSFFLVFVIVVFLCTFFLQLKKILAKIFKELWRRRYSQKRPQLHKGSGDGIMELMKWKSTSKLTAAAGEDVDDSGTGAETPGGPPTSSSFSRISSRLNSSLGPNSFSAVTMASALSAREHDALMKRNPLYHKRVPSDALAALRRRQEDLATVLHARNGVADRNTSVLSIRSVESEVPGPPSDPSDPPSSPPLSPPPLPSSLERENMSAGSLPEHDYEFGYSLGPRVAGQTRTSTAASATELLPELGPHNTRVSYTSSMGPVNAAQEAAANQSVRSRLSPGHRSSSPPSDVIPPPLQPAPSAPTPVHAGSATTVVAGFDEPQARQHDNGNNGVHRRLSAMTQSSSRRSSAGGTPVISQPDIS